MLFLEMSKMQNCEALSPEAQTTVNIFMESICALDTMKDSEDTYTAHAFEAAEKKLRDLGETKLADQVHEATGRTLLISMAAVSMFFQNMLVSDLAKRGRSPIEALPILASMKADMGKAGSARRPN